MFKKLIKNWPGIISFIIFVGLLCLIFCFDGNPADKISLIALVGTALIYSFQLNNMQQQKDIAKETAKNQENALKLQCDIAEKQYNFNVFTLRMNLRNDLAKCFTIALSSEGLSITNDVNMHLVNIGKICDDIKFAFPYSAGLSKAIKDFKQCCTDITNLEPEKRIIIECSLSVRDNWVIMTYRDCLRVSVDMSVAGGKPHSAVVSSDLCAKFGFSEKEKTIIFGIMAKYILVAKTKEELDFYMFASFRKVMDAGNKKLKQIFEILDKDIVLKSCK